MFGEAKKREKVKVGGDLKNESQELGERFLKGGGGMV